MERRALSSRSCRVGFVCFLREPPDAILVRERSGRADRASRLGHIARAFLKPTAEYLLPHLRLPATAF